MLVLIVFFFGLSHKHIELRCADHEVFLFIVSLRHNACVTLTQCIGITLIGAYNADKERGSKDEDHQTYT